MKIQWNKVTWYSKIAAVVLGIGIFALGIYVGVLYQRGLDAIEIAAKLKIKMPSVVERKTESVYGFTQEGTIKNMAAGDVEEDDWVLVYEVPGAPALMKKVVFTTESRCLLDGVVAYCDTSKFAPDQQVKVMGRTDTDGKIVVELLEAVR